MAPDPDKSDLLDKNSIKIIQSVVGTMLYYVQSLDPTMIQSINEISRVQSWPTRDTEEKARMLLDYAATYPNGIFRYKCSDMVLNLDSDAAYLTMPEARIYYACRFYLIYWPSLSPIKPNSEINGPYTRSVKQSEICCPLQRKLKHVAPSTTGKQLLACNQN